MPNLFPVVFHNKSNDDYHFIIKELANECERQFECLGEGTEKYKTFFVSIVAKADKEGNENIIMISYKIKFIDSTRFVASSLSNLVDNLVEWIDKIEVKIGIVFLDMKASRTIW